MDAHADSTRVAEIGSRIIEPSAPGVVVSDDELVDLRRIARERGISTEEAIARFAWQNLFALLVTDIREKYPDSFSSAEVVSESPAGASIGFSGTVPEELDAMVRSAVPSVRVQVFGGEGLSQVEIDSLVIAAHRAVSKTGLAGDVVSSFDRETGRVMVAAGPGIGRSDDPVSLENQILKALPEEVTDRLDLRVIPSLGTGDDSRYGGGRLELAGSGDLKCTAGFNVRDNVTDVTGIATAGHCTNSLTHENQNGDPEYAATLQGSDYRGTWGDFQWHTTTDSEPDDFYYDEGLVRDVTGRAYAVENQTVCRFGVVTKAECDTVDDTSVCSTVDGYESCHLVKMDHDEAEGGDSGGPWYYGNTAYGFHKGSVSCGLLYLSSCDVWSQAMYIGNALGVTVRWG